MNEHYGRVIFAGEGKQHISNVILSSAAPAFAPLPLLNQMETQVHIHPKSRECPIRYKDFELVVSKDVNPELLLQGFDLVNWDIHF